MVTWRFIAPLLILGSAVVACSHPEPLHFSVRMEEGGELRPDSPVVYRDVIVGRVLSIQPTPGDVTIRVEIQPEHRGQIYREARFSVARCGAQPCLRLEDAGDTRTEVEEDDVVDVRPGWFERLSRRLGEVRGSAEDLLDQAKSELSEAVGSFEQSEEFKTFRETLAEAGQDVALLARTQIERFVQEDLPKLEERAQAYRDKLEREGRRTEAEIFWKWFQRWAEAMRNRAKQPEASPTSPEKEP